MPSRSQMKCATSWTKIRGNSARVQSRAIRRSRRNDPACTGPRRSRNPRTIPSAPARPPAAAFAAGLPQCEDPAKETVPSTLRTGYRWTQKKWPPMNADERGLDHDAYPRLSAFIGGQSCSRRLEVQPQRQLELPVGAQADLVGHGRGERAEVAAGGGSGVRLTGLQDSGRVRQPGSAAAGCREDGVIEDVVAFRPELRG